MRFDDQTLIKSSRKVFVARCKFFSRIKKTWYRVKFFVFLAKRIVNGTFLFLKQSFLFPEVMK